MKNKPNPPVDLQDVTVLPASEWRRIQDSVNRVNTQHERVIAAARQREAMHLQSKEFVKTWSNTLAVSQHSHLSYDTDAVVCVEQVGVYQTLQCCWSLYTKAALIGQLLATLMLLVHLVCIYKQLIFCVQFVLMVL